MKQWLDRLSSNFWIFRSPATGIALGLAAFGWMAAQWSGRPVGFLLAVALGLSVRLALGVGFFSRKRRRELAEAQMFAPGLGSMIAAWWERGYRMDYTRRQTKEAFLVNGLVTRAKRAPDIHDLKATIDNDLTCLVSPGPAGVKGGGIDKLLDLGPALKHTVGCADVKIHPTGSGHAVIKFLWSDPLGRILRVADMPKGAADELVFGVWEDGSAAGIEMGMHTLVGGMTKMGKSSFLWALLADVIRKGQRTQVHVIDPKGGSEFFDVVPHVGIWHNGLLIASYVKTGDEESIGTLNAVVAEMKERQGANSEAGIRKWTPSMSDEQPLTILLVDECLEVFETWANHKGPRETVKGQAMAKFTKTLLSQGRAAGFMVIGLTQTAEVNALGSGVRRMFPNRFALGTDNAMATDMILGDNAAANGAKSHEIRTPGVGYAWREGERGFRKFRAAWCTDDDRARIAAGELPDGLASVANDAPQRYYNYSFYTADRQPLRTGITNDFDRRYKEYQAHYAKERAAIEAGRLDPAKALHQWLPYHDITQTKITEADGFAHAKRIESEIIADGVWRYNHQENMKNPLRNVPPVVDPKKPHRSLFHRTPKPEVPSRKAVRLEVERDAPTQPTNVTPLNRRDIRRELNRRSA